ncbi:MAG: VanZ family protein [Bacteroidaceae bacterium]|nr:VanZ family protein [Bacteroidaceae bacterium]
MIQFIKKYPLSLLIIAVILFLSLFNPPKTKLDPIVGIDKVVHACMYLGLELIIWIEYLRHHNNLNWIKILFLGIIAPIVFGGLVEIAQAKLTQGRSGEWADLLADAIGVLLGAAIGFFAIQTIFRKKQ